MSVEAGAAWLCIGALTTVLAFYLLKRSLAKRPHPHLGWPWWFDPAWKIGLFALCAVGPAALGYGMERTLIAAVSGAMGGLAVWTLYRLLFSLQILRFDYLRATVGEPPVPSPVYIETEDAGGAAEHPKLIPIVNRVPSLKRIFEYSYALLVYSVVLCLWGFLHPASAETWMSTVRPFVSLFAPTYGPLPGTATQVALALHMVGMTSLWVAVSVLAVLFAIVKTPKAIWTEQQASLRAAPPRIEVAHLIAGPLTALMAVIFIYVPLGLIWPLTAGFGGFLLIVAAMVTLANAATFIRGAV